MTMTTERPADDTPAALTPAEARSALAAEWDALAPTTPAEINEFYARSERLGDDLEAFHSFPERQRWTEIAVHVATNQEAKIIVDIGCGAGHDLRALSEAVPSDVTLIGVEPNDALRAINSRAFTCVSDMADAPIEDADLLLCFDVLEHVPDPEAFTTSFATRAKVGTYLIEAVATHDCGTPLHLKENRGWHPGHALEAAGWEKIDREDRVRVWRRFRLEAIPRATIVVCAYRSVSIPTHTALMRVASHSNETGYRVVTGGEAGINRSRSIQASVWLRETADDVLVMIDDDLVFKESDLDRLVDLCRNGHDIVCAAYPVRDGGHLAIRGLGEAITFGPNLEPIKIRHGATGFIAYHRRVIEAMSKTLPLCHANQAWAFWPMFDFETIEDEAAGGYNYLSEDYVMSERAHALGFETWLDPSLIMGHLGLVEINVRNMAQIHTAITGKAGG